MWRDVLLRTTTKPSEMRLEKQARDEERRRTDKNAELWASKVPATDREDYKMMKNKKPVGKKPSHDTGPSWKMLDWNAFSDELL